MIQRFSILFLNLLLLGAATGMVAQVHINGTVVRSGEPSEAVEMAAVRLLNIKDSAMVKGTVTDREGRFDLMGVRQGDYLLHVTYVGLDPLYQRLHISGSKTPVDVGRLTMTEDGVLLGEAVVTARAVEVQVKNDTVEYSASAYKVAEGSVLEDLLKKMPGVEVSAEGAVTVNGKEIKKILVDGKEFFSDDPKAASKNLPAQIVDKVQTYEKKSDLAMLTGFDDGDAEAVINLTVKPGMKQGWFGNAFAGAGSRGRYDVNTMLNRFVDDDQFSLMGGINNTNNMGFTDFAAAAFGGTVLTLPIVWALSDIALGLLGILNLIVIVRLAPWVIGALRDFESQRAQGITEPTFIGHGNSLLPGDVVPGIWEPDDVAKRG